MKTTAPPPAPTIYEAKIPFDERRFEILAELMRITGKSTPEGVIRLAIWHYAHFQKVGNLHHDDV